MKYIENPLDGTGLVPFPTSAADIAGVASAIRNDGLSVISTHPIGPNAIDTTTSALGATGRIEFVPTANIISISAVYGGWYVVSGTGSGENPIPNTFMVRASLQPMGATINEAAGDPVFRVLFNGKKQAYIKGGDFVFSDERRGRVWPANIRAFVKTFVSANLPAAPTAPVLSQSVSTGSFASPNAYSVSIVYVYPENIESQASTATVITFTSTNNTLTVTAPSSVSGALGYAVYLSGSTTATPQYSTGMMWPFGTDAVIGSPAAGASFLNLPRVLPGTNAIPYGSGVHGGTTVNGRNNGEGIRTGEDYTSDARAVSSAFNGIGIGPIALLGRTADGTVLPSVGVGGDSINTFSNDYAFAVGRGGWMERFLLRQTTRMYDPSVLPRCGFVKVSQPGEEAKTFANETSGNRRSEILSLTTAVVTDYGTNDLTVSSAPPATVASYLVTIGQRFTQAKQVYNHTPLLPRATSATDPLYAIANQSVVTLIETYRRSINNWILGGAASVYTDEVPFRRQSAATTSSTNLLSGGDGTTVVFIAQRPLLTSSLSVKVGGSITAAYTVFGAQTIGGVAYASGVQFTVAPTNGQSVTFSYTSMPGMVTMVDPLLCKIQSNLTLDIEVDASGTSAINGGWWRPSSTSAAVTGTASASNTSTTFNTGLTWTQNQYAGYSIAILTDTTTPTAVGQSRGIQTNTTAGVISLNASDAWTVTPSSAATYAIIDDIPTSDGTHPGTYGHMKMSARVDATKFGL